MIWVALLFALSQSTAPAATPSPAEDPLVGLWAAEVTFGPALRGNLTLSRDGLQWRATLGNVGTTFTRDGNSIRFAFPGNLGGFRGALDPRERAATGFWLQPPGGPQDPRDPGGSGQSFASPLVLRRVGGNAWRGTVEPLEDRFTLYLKIFRDSDGTLKTAFRNPELHSHGPAMQLSAEQNGDQHVRRISNLVQSSRDASGDHLGCGRRSAQR